MAVLAGCAAGAKKGAAEVMEHKWFKKVEWDAVRHQQVRPSGQPAKSHPASLTNAADC